MIADWNRPFFFQSPYGTLNFNDQTFATGYYLLAKERCRVGIDVRAESNDIPQADGTILHRRWLTGVVMELAVGLWDGPEDPACDDQLQLMLDTLILHARAVQNAGDNEGRVLWTPSGYPTRMLDDAKLLSYPAISIQDDTVTEVAFSIETGFPYAIDLTQTSTAVANGATETLTNAGTAEFWPVFQVQGPATTFEVANDTLGLSFIYDSSLPGAQAIGGGEYAEIDTFRNTIYLNGDQDNLKPGIDVVNSDFWPMPPGENDVRIDGAAMTVLWQSAWG